MLEDLLENRILSYIRQRALATNQGYGDDMETNGPDCRDTPTC